jgi:hypothetical protein
MNAAATRQVHAPDDAGEGAVAPPLDPYQLRGRAQPSDFGVLPLVGSPSKACAVSGAMAAPMAMAVAKASKLAHSALEAPAGDTWVHGNLYTGLMRRWLAILMLTLLPLQFGWSAVAAYCGHETGEQAQHLGHHEHQHAADASADDGHSSPDERAPVGFDFDCGHCHCTCATLPTVVGDVVPLDLPSYRAAPVEGAMRTLAPSRPERPQWLGLA